VRKAICAIAGVVAILGYGPAQPLNFFAQPLDIIDARLAWCLFNNPPINLNRLPGTALIV
jgi:hypothetical protein